MVEVGGLQPGAQQLIPFPFVNMAGVSTSLVAWLTVGGGLHHHHPFDIDVFIEQLPARLAATNLKCGILNCTRTIQ